MLISEYEKKIYLIGQIRSASDWHGEYGDHEKFEDRLKDDIRLAVKVIRLPTCAGDRGLLIEKDLESKKRIDEKKRQNSWPWKKSGGGPAKKQNSGG